MGSSLYFWQHMYATMAEYHTAAPIPALEKPPHPDRRLNIVESLSDDGFGFGVAFPLVKTHFPI